MPFNGERTTKVVSGKLWGSWHVSRSKAQLTNEQTVRVIINVLTLLMFCLLGLILGIYIGIFSWDNPKISRDTRY